VEPLDIIGQPVLRREGARFLLGRGRWFSDVPIDSALSMVVVRSPHAHARIAGIDLDEARRLPGVIGAFRLSDLPLNPLHVKGTGEGSAVPGPAAIANAVADAPGIELTECPVRAERLVRSVHPS
jgi:carbon-monoxide dehydrogenase large subunit